MSEDANMDLLKAETLVLVVASFATSSTRIGSAKHPTLNVAPPWRSGKGCRAGPGVHWSSSARFCAARITGKQHKSLSLPFLLSWSNAWEIISLAMKNWITTTIPILHLLTSIRPRRLR